jgi:hypothetical protein
MFYQRSDCSDWRDATVQPALRSAIRKMESLGATFCNHVSLPTYDEWSTRWETDADAIVRAELKEGLAEYLSGMQSSAVKNLRDIIE